MSSSATIPVSRHVTQDIRDYVPLDGFAVVSKRKGERSITLDWSVRVSAQLDDKGSVVVTGDDRRHIKLLLETMRVLNNNLPFRIGEYEE
ncbi:hypothetical protein GN958_ATG19684 [Phytophthora infestans]|uniref:Uncharacterized protein n=1 Tax=Phytophthora infestans TaxID=4787 RepID=A0A8S9TWF0_PHYIN|nr:hypothetical protein GN958_ATG19684 [Phytophthora infestans]